MGATAKPKDICPTCFAMYGFSVPLKKDGEYYQCTKNHMHRFKKDKNGFLVKV